jgi:hypothetical protein
METSTMPGLEKAFKQHGFVKEYVVMTKQIEKLPEEESQEFVEEEQVLEVAYGR